MRIRPSNLYNLRAFVKYETRTMARKLAKRNNQHYTIFVGEMLDREIRQEYNLQLKEKIWTPCKEIKFLIFKRDSRMCRYCNQEANQIDHILPRWAIGSSNSPKNLVACCGRCNLIAGAKVFKSFKDKKDYIIEELERRSGCK